ncbi:ABC transporter substrate binding protein, partial [Desulfobacterales bacterium HSG17]|nr:ABC transporter substrate binding protein [Desulfobacterales bacterium HSG17]
QSLFVVPYLKDKVKTPVMFCGVNAVPDKYGYPASNVSGILERYHINESIAFAKQLVPSIKTIGFLGKDSPTALAGLKQVQQEVETYPAKFIDFKMPKTFEELESMTKELKDKCDTMLLLTLKGIPKADGTLVQDKDGIPIIAKIFGKPLIGVSAFQANYGVLCTVINTGQEQGNIAAVMLLKAMQGILVSDIPVTMNHKGKRIINATIMQSLGIKLRPEILRGAELVRTEE